MQYTLDKLDPEGTRAKDNENEQKSYYLANAPVIRSYLYQLCSEGTK